MSRRGFLKYTRIENAHKVRKKTFVFYYVSDWLLHVQLRGKQDRYWLVWAIMIDLPELPISEEARNDEHIASTAVLAHPGLPHQETKRETSDALKIQLNQASWNRTVLKFGSENQLDVHNCLWIFFSDFTLIAARSGKSHVTISLIGCAPHTQSIGPRYWRMWKWLAFEYMKTSVDKKQVSKNKIHASCLSNLTIGKIILLQHFIFVISLFGCPLSLDAQGRRLVRPLPSARHWFNLWTERLHEHDCRNSGHFGIRGLAPRLVMYKDIMGLPSHVGL